MSQFNVSLESLPKINEYFVPKDFQLKKHLFSLVVQRERIFHQKKRTAHHQSAGTVMLTK
jgi:hypothetical protein